ncbi:MAG: biopolymer transporter ExbD [Planctomycetaceae bacterium]|jgi:biopolymer transport protein ExbD|nr:biopolymer transporter ExbD [Planctomycetaceae bacterium]
MRFNRTTVSNMELDMTPMIDIVFLLITFFMFVFNFSQADQNERIKLPSSELAKISEVSDTEFLTLQLTAEETILFGREEFAFDELKRLLSRELKLFEALGTDKSKVRVLIRADARSQTGKLQDIMAECRRCGLENFGLPVIIDTPGAI